MSISRDDWVKAVQDAEAADNDPDAITIVEFCELIGLKREAATKRMNTLVQNGRAVKTRKLIRQSNGTPIGVTAYRLIPKEAPDADATRH